MNCETVQQYLDAYVDGELDSPQSLRVAEHCLTCEECAKARAGLEALRQLKKDETTKAIPVVVITANGHHLARKESQNCGASVFLTKPFSPLQLLTEIRKIIPPEEGKSS